MIEVIRQGFLPENDYFEADCRNCKSAISFQRKDGKVTFDQRDGDFITVDCPVCAQPVHVTTAKANVKRL